MRTLTLGLHLIVLLIDRVGYKMNVQENVLDIPEQKVVDNASVQVDAVASGREVVLPTVVRQKSSRHPEDR